MLCNVCRQLDLDAIFRHGILEKSSLAEDGNVPSDSTYDLAVPSAEAGTKRKPNQPDNEVSLLDTDDLRETVDLKRPAIDIGYLDEIMPKGHQCLFCHIVFLLAIYSHPYLFKIPTEIVTEGEELDTEGDDLEFVDPSERLRCYLLTFSANELRDFRTPNSGKPANYIEVQFRDRHGQKLPRRQYLLQDTMDAKADCEQLSGTRTGSQISFYNARPLKKGQADIKLIKSWMSFCENSHTYPNCMLNSCAPANLPTSLRVIDVHSRRVVDAPPSCRYIALSYVWGGSSVKSDYIDNKSSSHVPYPFSKQLPATLPATLEDAVTLVKQLGESFLWIDSFCIDQASEADKASQVGIMDKIYSNASLTIIAAHGFDADAGLPGVQPDSRDPQVQTWAEIKGRRIFLSLPSLEEEFENGAWMSRGWTYQEGLLSPRCLIFSGYQVFWKCAAELLSEGIAEADPSQRIFTKPPNYSEILSSPLVHLGGDMEEEKRDDSRSPVPFQEPYHDYIVHVEEYTSRQLSYESDMIPAFKGISNVLERRFQTEMLWGLAESVFDLALLWRPMSMRKTGLEGRTPGVPTWSWASWPGHIRYIREIEAVYVDHETHAQPLHSYWKEDIERRLSRVNQNIQPSEEGRPGLGMEVVDEAGSDSTTQNQRNKAQAYTQFLHFETESAKLPLYPTPKARRFCVHPILAPASESEVWTQPDIGESIYIDNPYDDRLSQSLKDSPGKEWEFILLSTWDETHAIGWGERKYERYKEPVYNVLMIEWEGDVAYRIGMGHVKVSIWKAANAVSKKIKLG